MVAQTVFQESQDRCLQLNRDFSQADYYVEGRLFNQAESSLSKRFLAHSALKSGASNIF